MRCSICVLGLVLLLGGCGQGSFIGRRYDNFTAYYNKFYNAQLAYEEGVESVEQRNEAIDRTIYLSVFDVPGRSAGSQRFQDAINKSADVLREHPNSKWVDDALLIIGKARFYLQDYVGAQEKFQEVVGLDSKLEDEARFWLARTLVASGQYEAAAAHLQESLGREDLSRRWAPKLRLALGELYVRRGELDNAVQELEEGLERVSDNKVGGRAQFLLGQLYESMGRYEDAIAAFEAVQHHNPLYELSYAANMSAIRVEGLHGDPERALQELRRMERDDKNYENRGELAYLRGRIYQAMGRIGEALSTYDELLYSDAGVGGGDVRGRVHYALGELYRDVFQDFTTAAAYFDTASGAIRGPQNNQRIQDDIPSAAAITDANEQAETFGTFATVREEISRADSLLRLGQMDQERFEEFILELRKQRAEELEEERRRQERLAANRQFQNRSRSSQNAGGLNSRKQIPGQGASGGSTTQTGGGDSGFLYHQDQARVQEGRINFVQIWGDRPLVPNWRRVEAIRATSQEGGEGTGEGADLAGLPGGEGEGATGLPMVDISAVPRDSAQQAAMREERAMARYELGNVLFLSMNRPDSAAAWYRMVIEENPEHPVSQRAYYALAEVHRALGDTLQARRLYRTILDQYPDSDFSGRAREYLQVEPEQQVVSDSLALAEGAYDQAYAQWQRGAYAEALNNMVALAANFRGMELAPRALYAAGSVYMDWARRDSLDLLGALPLTVPDSLLRTAGFFEVAMRSARSSQQRAQGEAEQQAAQAAGEDPILREKQASSGQQTSENEQASAEDQILREKQAAREQRLEQEQQADSEQQVLREEQAASEQKLQEELPAREQQILREKQAAKEEHLRQEQPVDSTQDALGKPNQAEAPSDVTPSDGIQTFQDSLAVSSDSRTASSDSLAMPADSVATSPDSLAISPDSVATSPDSLATPPDSVAASPDSLAVQEPDSLSLDVLYTVLVEQYPQAPQADVAKRVLQALDETRQARQHAQQAADSTAAQRDTLAVAPSDSTITASDSTVSDALSAQRDTTQSLPEAQDTTGVQVPVDTTTSSAHTPVKSAAPADSTEAPSDPVQGHEVPERMKKQLMQQDSLGGRDAVPLDSTGLPVDTSRTAPDSTRQHVPDR